MPAVFHPFARFEDESPVTRGDAGVVEAEAALPQRGRILQVEGHRVVVFRAANEVAAGVGVGCRRPSARRNAHIGVLQEVSFAPDDPGEAEGHAPAELPVDTQREFVGVGLLQVGIDFVARGQEDLERRREVHFAVVHQRVEVPVVEAETRGRLLVGVRVGRDMERELVEVPAGGSAKERPAVRGQPVTGADPRRDPEPGDDGRVPVGAAADAE